MLPEEGFYGQLSLRSTGSVPLSNGDSKWGAYIYFAIAASFRECFVGLCSVGPFWDKDCEMDNRVVGQGRAKAPVKAPEEAELALERLCSGDRLCPSRVGLEGEQVYRGPKTKQFSGPPRPSEWTAQPQPPGYLEKGWPASRRSLPSLLQGLCVSRRKCAHFSGHP